MRSSTARSRSTGRRHEASPPLRRPGRCSRPRPRELDRLDARAVGSPAARAHARLPRPPLRPARPRPLGGPTRAVHRGAARARAARAARRPRDRTSVLLRALARRRRRPVARRERRRPPRPARPGGHLGQLRAAGALDRAGCDRPGRGNRAASPTRPWSAGSLRPSRASAPFRAGLLATPAEGYAACCDAIAAWDFRGSLGSIAVPTLVLVGADDPATTPDDARLIAEAIPGASLTVIPNAAHLLNVEQPDAFDRAVLAHLAGEEPQ